MGFLGIGGELVLEMDINGTVFFLV